MIGEREEGGGTVDQLIFVILSIAQILVHRFYEFTRKFYIFSDLIFLYHEYFMGYKMRYELTKLKKKKLERVLCRVNLIMARRSLSARRY